MGSALAPPGPGGLPRQVVLDASVVGAWSFNEADTPVAQRVEVLVDSGAVRALVPSLFWAEFQQVCRRKWNQSAARLADVEQSYAAALAKDLVEVPEELVLYREPAWDWMRALNIGSYDAYYLSMGLALGLEVWTFDRPFRNATLTDARAAGRVRVPGEDVAV